MTQRTIQVDHMTLGAAWDAVTHDVRGVANAGGWHYEVTRPDEGGLQIRATEPFWADRFPVGFICLDMLKARRGDRLNAVAIDIMFEGDTNE